MAASEVEKDQIVPKSPIEHYGGYDLIHARKVHTSPVLSPLDGNAPVQDYRGFHNLIMLLLFVNNLRLIVENYMKYGWLIELPNSYFYPPSPDFVTAGLLLAMLVVPNSLILTFEIVAARMHGIRKPVKSGSASTNEDTVVTATSSSMSYARVHSKPVHRKKRSSNSNIRAVSDIKKAEEVLKLPSTTPWWLIVVQAFLLSWMFVFPNVWTYLYINNPLLATVPCFWSTINAVKMTSFVLVNAELRSLAYAGVVIPEYDISQAFPYNLSISNVVYFLMAPTLCYQASYPRTATIRWSFVLRRLIELVCLMGMMWIIVEQYSRPTLLHSLRPFHELNFVALFERLLKLSIPSIYIWLLGFYALFHSYLNMWAEVLRFADREFYKPWWNASTISQYWRLWNIPVYTFFKRHVYVPMRHADQPRWKANMAAFLISAIAHEVVIGVPTQVLEGWAFMGMLSQIPLITLSEWLYRPPKHETATATKTGEYRPDPDDLTQRPANVGNYLFWVSFCILGQPLSSLLYYRAYYMAQNPELVRKAVERL